MKQFLKYILLGFLCLCIIYCLVGKTYLKTKSEEVTTVAIAPEENTGSIENHIPKEQNADFMCSMDSDTKVIAYYFHRNQRCRTCQVLETHTKEAIEKGFSKEINEGRLEFKIVNFEKVENRHFIKEYNLFASTLIISQTICENELDWKDLKGVWRLIRNKPKFFEYVQSNIKKFLA